MSDEIGTLISFKLSNKSLKKLSGVHPDLVRVVKQAIILTPIDFAVTEGLRTIERQKLLVESGASMTMNSQHLVGRAVDLVALVDGDVRWDWPLYHKLAQAMKAAADYCMIKICWGGDWENFKDGPHFELAREIKRDDE